MDLIWMGGAWPSHDFMQGLCRCSLLDGVKGGFFVPLVDLCRENRLSSAMHYHKCINHIDFSACVFKSCDI